MLVSRLLDETKITRAFNFFITKISCTKHSHTPSFMWMQEIKSHLLSLTPPISLSFSGIHGSPLLYSSSLPGNSIGWVYCAAGGCCPFFLFFFNFQCQWQLRQSSVQSNIPSPIKVHLPFCLGRQFFNNLCASHVVTGGNIRPLGCVDNYGVSGQ